MRRSRSVGFLDAVVKPYPSRGYRKQREMFQGETMIKREKGFSLIELLIVVAIILIIAAIAIPNLLRSRMAANEASAVGSIRTMNTAAITFSSIYGDGFPPTLATLGGIGATTCKNAELTRHCAFIGREERLQLRTHPRYRGSASGLGSCWLHRRVHRRLRCDCNAADSRYDRTARVLFRRFGCNPL